MPGRPRRFAIAAFLVGLAVLLGVACVGVQPPEGWAGPVVDGDTLFASLDDGKMTAVQLQEGLASRIWTFPNDARSEEKRLETEAIYPAPVVDAERVYVATYGEGVFALARADGRVAWRRADLGDSIVSAFSAVGEGLLAVGTSDGRVHVLRMSDGEPAFPVAWPRRGREVGSGVWASLIEEDGTLFVATMRGELYGFDLQTGAERWGEPFRADGAIPELALLPNGRLFVPSLDRRVYLVDVGTGRAAVEPFAVAGWVWMRPAVSEGVAFFGDLEGNLYGLDITSGSGTWSTSVRDRVKAPPLVIGDVLVVADRAPAVHFFAVSDGRRLNTVPIDAKTVRAPLVRMGDRALVLSTNGRLFLANPQDLSVVELAIQGGAK